MLPHSGQKVRCVRLPCMQPADPARGALEPRLRQQTELPSRKRVGAEREKASELPGHRFQVGVNVTRRENKRTFSVMPVVVV